jgi:hypothetical protein
MSRNLQKWPRPHQPRSRPHTAAAEREVYRLTRLTEQLVTAVTALEARVADLEEQFRYGGRLSDELFTPLLYAKPKGQP